MRTLSIVITSLLFFSSLAAQWTQVNNRLTNTNITSMFAYVDTIMVGTEAGIFKTQDEGTSWQNINGDLANTQINDIRGGGGSKVIWVATKNGLFFTQDHTNYTDQTSTGLTNNDINYYWFGDGDESKWAVGTNGGGLFTRPDEVSPWNNSSSGISGDGLFVNDLSGYSDQNLHYSVIATNDGFYFSTDTLKSWIQNNDSLRGDALKANRLFVLSNIVLAATDGGYYATFDFGNTWIEGITGEKMNLVGISVLGPGGFYYLLGENAYYSFDLATWNPIDLTGVSGGEITSVAYTSNYMFIGTQTGGVFKQPLSTVTAIPQITQGLTPQNFNLKQNYPNPFNPITTISYNLPNATPATLLIYDNLGQLVSSYTWRKRPGGTYYFSFDASTLASGTYYYQLQTDFGTRTKRMTLIK